MAREIRAEEYVTKKGAVDLYIYRKFVGTSSREAGSLFGSRLIPERFARL